MTNTFTPRVDFIATEVPEEVIRRAEIAIVTGAGWHIFGPHRAHCYEGFTLPDVACPIVGVVDVDEEAMADLLKKHLAPYGVHDLPGLLFGLVALGAEVINHPCPECLGTTKHCNDCQFLEEE